MDNNSQDIAKIISKKLTGKPLAIAESTYFSKWLAIGQNGTVFREIKTYWEAGNTDIEAKIKQNTWERFSEKAKNHEKGNHVFGKKPKSPIHANGLAKSRNVAAHLPKSGFVPRWAKVAAVLAPLMLIGLYFYPDQGSGTDSEYRETVNYIEKENGQGQKSTIRLSDGTVVTLNSKSKLKVPERFPKGKREVFLEGEAFFEVKADPDRPFIVFCKDVATTVKGTSFNINTDPSHNNKQMTVQVAVLTGSVLVENSLGEGVLLRKENMVNLDDKGNFQQANFDQEEVMGWKDGILLFKSATFEEIVNRLEDWFGVQIEVRAEIPEGSGFSGRYQNEKLENILRSLGFAYGFSYVIEDDIIFIK